MRGSRSIPLIVPSPSLPQSVIEGDRIRKQQCHAVLPIRRGKPQASARPAIYPSKYGDRAQASAGKALRPRPGHSHAREVATGDQSRRTINGTRSTDRGELANGPAMVPAMVQLGGLEPPTSCSTDRRSNQLSYNCIRHGTAREGRPNGPETRCNGRIWQGRERIKSPAMTAFFDAVSARVSPRSSGEPRKHRTRPQRARVLDLPAVHAGARPHRAPGET